jgi:HKD family nuclease
VARLATASLTRAGLHGLERALANGRKSPKIKLLVGLYNGHTEAAALRKLLTLQKRTGASLEVRIARNSRFHWKLYMFSGPGRLVAYVGSSNLTGDGLGTEGEFNLRLSGTSRDRPLVNITDTFERSWRKDAFPLDQMISDKFAPVSKRSGNITKGIDPQIRRLLRRAQRTIRSTTRAVRGATSCYTFFDEFAVASTRREVRHKTGWDSKGWDWIVFDTKSKHDRVLKAGSFYLGEIHRKGGILSLNDVRDDDEFRTVDGRYFVAYQKRKGSVAKSLNSKTLKLLKDKGFIRRKDDLRRNRTMGMENRTLLNTLLNA